VRIRFNILVVRIKFNIFVLVFVTIIMELFLYQFGRINLL